MEPIQLGIHGAAGRMGRRLIALADEDPNLQTVAAVDSKECKFLGEDAGALAGIPVIAVPITDTLPSDCGAEVVIDFSLPAGAASIAKQCVERNVALVLATTGLDEEQTAVIQSASQNIPIVWAPSMSLAVNLTMKLSQIAAAAFANHPGGVDAEIIEWHHRHKEDAPSGTALKFGEIISEEMKQTVHQHGREGRCGARPHGEIGYHAVRAGDHPGEHRILFGMPGESVELRVSASNRDSYAHGAFTAAKWLVNQSPGLYNMQQVLEL